METQQNSAELTIIYGMDDNSINADTLTETLRHIIEALRIIDAEIYPNIHFDYEISAFQPGSFWTVLKKKWQTGDIVYDIALGVFLHFSVEMINFDHNAQIPPPYKPIIENLNSNRDLRGSYAETFGKLKSDDKIKYIEFRADQTIYKNPVRMDRADFDIIAQGSPLVTPIYYENVEVEVIDVYRQKRDSHGTFKWNGKKIDAKISDLSVVNNMARRFFTGEKIRVSLVETPNFNLFSHQQIDSSFEITQISRQH